MGANWSPVLALDLPAGTLATVERAYYLQASTDQRVHHFGDQIAVAAQYAVVRELFDEFDHRKECLCLRQPGVWFHLEAEMLG
jgi:hypothetical protein